MPCSDSWTYGFTEEETKGKSSDIEVYQARNDKLARMLCEIMRSIEKHDTPIFDISLETLEWWSEHKKFDQNRR